MTTLHVTDARTTIRAQQCAHATPRSLDDDPDVVVVALAGSPAAWLAQWDGIAFDGGGRATVVVQEAVDWVAGRPRERIDRAAPSGTDVAVKTVDSVGNLTDLGVTLVEELDAYRTADSPTTLCFQSLTVLLQWSDVDTVYKFLHTLLGHLDGDASDTPDATAHFHLHGRAHEPDTVDRLRPLFDRVRHDPA
ncbi:DUF7504 family protein [Haloplanus salilacus]|uniref:DUF7504 family protein n=1 Tax=Haloplanus salilacus TaxID=2949994 RepID=UPI0030D3B0BD